ncbi:MULTISPECIES: cytochrome P450 [unclassified Chelatococcus]|jgi:cytochrome P450|uniref:cytochrome P450 n=1 Tax=unclassified Chelatococcus TaxID=2638111 RepID=UPI001BCF8905|nr:MULTISPECIES: cytochrome P450 [unclassified Chelatococcus]CAH1653332.1 Cytochrome P450-SU2 [Hyphomicrobiales bacterium]MBS7742915.1 cytochrome P450 [Chelatococcus sp. HY11]MBX3541967.1 cytochrome P450 [Chelatococcus sp.]MCO5074141.1 cytochrome P450 [Chelatococcus sp.]CAH1694362.1 Cytochrome P450-SU2 [Hyphomicrobiales bacterium]
MSEFAAASCPFSGMREYPIKRANPLDPAPELAELRADEPFAKVRLWTGQDAWLVTRYDDVRKLLTDPRVSADNTLPNFPGATPGMLAVRTKYPSFITMDVPEHTQFRRMLTGEFAVKKIEALKPRIQQVVDERIDAILAKGPPSDIVRDLTLALPITMICDLLGVPYEDQDFFHAKADLITDSRTPPDVSSKAIQELCDVYIAGLIEKKNQHPTDDLLSRLVVNQLRPGHLTPIQLIGIARLLLIAGHDTSAHTMSLGILALLENPEQKRALIDDPTLINSTVEEILRYVDVTHNGRRRIATADIEMGDHVIRKGEGIIAHNAAANRDSDVFPDADKFRIHRDARHHIAFGYGVHQCLGQPLARAELQIVIGTLFRRIPSLALAAPVSSLEFKETSFVYGVERIPVTWES